MNQQQQAVIDNLDAVVSMMKAVKTVNKVYIFEMEDFTGMSVAVIIAKSEEQALELLKTKETYHELTWRLIKDQSVLETGVVYIDYE